MQLNFVVVRAVLGTKAKEEENRNSYCRSIASPGQRDHDSQGECIQRMPPGQGILLCSVRVTIYAKDREIGNAHEQDVDARTL